MSKFDGNVWYHITETRVDKNVNGNFSSAFQITNKDLRVFAWDDGNSAHLWQLLPTDNGKYFIRNQQASVGKQLGLCYVPEEIDSSKTQPCLEPSGNDNTQKWEFQPWGDGLDSYKFINVHNGSNYYMDVHPGSNLFLNGAIDPTVTQPAQRWRISSYKPINDGAYSTTFPGSTPTTDASGVVHTPSDSPSTTNGLGNNPTAPSSSLGSKSGLSPGAAAGIGVGVTLAVLLALLGALFFLRRSRKRRNVAAPSEMESNYQPPVYAKESAPVQNDVKEVHEAPGDMPLYEAGNDRPAGVEVQGSPVPARPVEARTETPR